MSRFNRRNFLFVSAGGGVGALMTSTLAAAPSGAAPRVEGDAKTKASRAAPSAPARVDFRYAPLSYQTAFCFPDDPAKSLVGQMGELRFSRNPQTWPHAYYAEQVEFSCMGMEGNAASRQRLEAPGVPIVHTTVDRPAASLELTVFATNRSDEGRVDNVIMEVVPKGGKSLQVVPVMIVRTKRELKLTRAGDAGLVRFDAETGPVFVAASAPFAHRENTGLAVHCVVRRGVAKPGQPLRLFFRFPQENQSLEKIAGGLTAPDGLLAELRQTWRAWSPCKGEVSWGLHGPYQDFLIACARNILQAREVREGRLTFQVGPTCYRGLWVVDGNFILEAARYLGHDAAAREGLEATWARQGENGGVFAGGGAEHWKDTGIAMFTLVRQAELSQDWSYFKAMTPNVLRGVRFLKELRDKNRGQANRCARYGLLAPGFCDGGIGGLRSEFTNTLWALAGLKAVAEAGERLGMAEHVETRSLCDELRGDCFKAMRAEMRAHEAGFRYLPMVMKDDPQWDAADPWDRLRPQGAQWALSHAIYPGLLFDPQDAVVKGHLALMQHCTREDVPVETGWIPHEGLWTYNAAFVAHVYLWAGLADWARRTFIGFLNHASPLYCWREEQPLRGSLVSSYVGDMPHNWASAMCVLYLRHMLALEDGSSLRLLAGIGEEDLAAGEPYSLTATPTRFGRLTLGLEPVRKGLWRLSFRRTEGSAPQRVQLPLRLGKRLTFATLTGAEMKPGRDAVEVTPDAPAWSATWRAS